MMRLADQVECRAQGMDPLVALTRSKDGSDHWIAEGVDGGEPLAVWGWRTRSFLAQEADVWLLSFDGAEKHKMLFARRSRAKLDALLERFVVLRCEVHTSHARALRWLDWLGFVPEAVKFYNAEAFLVMIRERY